MDVMCVWRQDTGCAQNWARCRSVRVFIFANTACGVHSYGPPVARQGSFVRSFERFVLAFLHQEHTTPFCILLARSVCKTSELIAHEP
jgi:hypothetical protein